MSRIGLPLPRWLWDAQAVPPRWILLRADGSLTYDAGPDDPPMPTAAELAEQALLVHCLPQLPMTPSDDRGIPQPDLTGTVFDPLPCSEKDR